MTHFNPRPPCGGRQTFESIAYEAAEISIHVPRVEDDVVLYLCPKKHFISIHVPRVEDDPCGQGQGAHGDDFNPRPPCGGRLSELVGIYVEVIISIHVPRVEDDRKEILT